jgi:hypothetical protein
LREFPDKNGGILNRLARGVGQTEQDKAVRKEVISLLAGTGPRVEYRRWMRCQRVEPQTDPGNHQQKGNKADTYNIMSRKRLKPRKGRKKRRGEGGRGEEKGGAVAKGRRRKIARADDIFIGRTLNLFEDNGGWRSGTGRGSQESRGSLQMGLSCPGTHPWSRMRQQSKTALAS